MRQTLKFAVKFGSRQRKEVASVASLNSALLHRLSISLCVCVWVAVLGTDSMDQSAAAVVL